MKITWRNNSEVKQTKSTLGVLQSFPVGKIAEIAVCRSVFLTGTVI